MMTFVGTETLVTQLVNERSRVHANRNACTQTKGKLPLPAHTVSASRDALWQEPSEQDRPREVNQILLLQNPSSKPQTLSRSILLLLNPEH